MDSNNFLYDQSMSTSATDFLQSSAMNAYNSRELGERISVLMNSPYYSRQACAHSMEWGNTERISLQLSQHKRTKELRNFHLDRKTSRVFSSYITLDELSDVLLSAYFITERFEQHSHHLARRSISSGGALYPIDLYYISLHTKSLEKGIYAYNPHAEALETLRLIGDKELRRSLTKCFPKEVVGSWNMNSVSGIVVMGACLHRVCCKYGDRGLRFALMDTGGLCQNLYLAAAARSVACCAIGGYYDDELDKLMGFQWPNETSLLTMFIGK